MTMSKRVLSIALIVFLPVSGIAASTTVVDLRWQELAPLISGREVEIPLSSGGRARGEVLAVRADSIFMDVKKVSRTNYVKGRQSIERSEIPSLNLRKNTIRWRVVGTTAGIIAGLFAGVAVACVTGDPGLFFLIEGGLTTLGHLGGRAGDLKDMTIRIVE